LWLGKVSEKKILRERNYDLGGTLAKIADQRGELAQKGRRLLSKEKKRTGKGRKKEIGKKNRTIGERPIVGTNEVRGKEKGR